MGRTLLSAAFDLDSCTTPTTRLSTTSQANFHTRRRLPQVEQQDLGLARPLYYELLLLTDRGTVALVKVLAVQFDCSLCHLQPGVTALAQLVLRFLPRAEQGDI